MNHKINKVKSMYAYALIVGNIYSAEYDC